MGATEDSRRLDRGLANPNWPTSNPDYQVRHLPIIASDHSPILHIYVSHPLPRTKCFRFENIMWHSYQSFQEVVTSNWASSSSNNLHIKDKLTSLASKLQEWTR